MPVPLFVWASSRKQIFHLSFHIFHWPSDIKNLSALRLDGPFELAV